MDNYHVENESVLQELIKFLKEYFEVEQKSVEVQRFAREHPIVTIFLMVTIAMCAVPVVLFGIFVVGSIMFSFLGFLFVEGTVLAVGTIILGGVLFFAALLAIGVSAFVVVGYYSVMVVGADIVNSLQERFSGLKIPALSFLSRNRENHEE